MWVVNGCIHLSRSALPERIDGVETRIVKCSEKLGPPNEPFPVAAAAAVSFVLFRSCFLFSSTFEGRRLRL